MYDLVRSFTVVQEQTEVIKINLNNIKVALHVIPSKIYKHYCAVFVRFLDTSDMNSVLMLTHLFCDILEEILIVQ